MTSTTTLSTTPNILDSARRARALYEDAVASDGTSASAWDAIADAMRVTGNALNHFVGDPAYPALTPGVVRCHLDRARDAEHRADYAHRMVEVARNHRVIDLGTLVAGVAS